MPDIETSKRLSAERQIHAAIDHFHRNEFECAMTLAAAAEGLLPETDVPHIFGVIRRSPMFKQIDVNKFINWLKHPTPEAPTKAIISEFEVAITIARAVTKFHAVYDESTPQIDEFTEWFRHSEHVLKSTGQGSKSS